jgi:O-antigen/teichoic acid export membrane protein
MLYMVSKTTPGLLGMASTALLTRLLDPGQYGIYGLALVIMNLGQPMAFDWLGVAFLRFYQARRDDPRMIGTVLQLFAILIALAVGALLAAWAAGAFPTKDAPVYAVGLALMCSLGWFELVARFQIGSFQPMRYLVMNLGRGSLVLVGTVGAAWLTHNPVLACVGTAIGMVGGALLGTSRSWRVGPRYFDRDLAKSLLQFGLPLAASLTLASFINSGTRALVEILGSTAELGKYTAAFLLIQNTLAVMAGSIVSASYSLAVKAVETGDAALVRKQLLANGSLLLAIMAPASLGMALTAGSIAHTLVGAKYVDSVTILTPWLATGAFFAAIRAHYLDHAFQLGKRPYRQVRVSATAAVIAIGLCFWLIPTQGSIGAAFALVAAMAVSCVHSWFEGLKAQPIPLPLHAAGRILPACAVMAAVVLAIPGHGPLSFALQVSLGGLAYLSAGVAFDVLGARDRVLAILRSRLARLTRQPPVARAADPIATE